MPVGPGWDVTAVVTCSLNCSCATSNWSIETTYYFLRSAFIEVGQYAQLLDESSRYSGLYLQYCTVDQSSIMVDAQRTTSTRPDFWVCMNAK